MVITSPSPLRDQTIESVGALAWAKNPWSTWMETAKAVFGAATTSAGSAIHAGVGHCFDVLSGLGYASPEDLLANHSYLPLFRPFLTSRAYELSQQSMIGGNIRRLVNLSKLRVIEPGLRFCPACISSDLEHHGYSYARRTHQIVGVQACHLHGVSLLKLCDEGSDGFARHGLLMPETDGVPMTWQLNKAVGDEPSRFSIRYAQFAAAALTGTLQVVQVQHRQAAYRQRIGRELTDAKTTLISLTGLIRSQISDAALSHMGLGLASPATANWPAIFLDGSGYANHPVANLLVIALLFKDAADFNHATANSDADNATENLNSGSIGVGIPRVGMTMALIKSLMRPGTLAEIASKHGLDIDTVKKLLASYPSLLQRRPMALWRCRRSACRATLLKLVADNPKWKRSNAELAIRAEYEWLMRHDRAWLDNQLPASRPKSVRTVCYDISIDIALASKAHQLLSQLVAKQGEHSRRSWTGLISQLQLSEQKLLRSGRIPIASAAIRSLEESKIQHRERCLSRISDCINDENATQVKRWATELLMTYPQDKTLVGMVVSRLIHEIEQPAGHMTS